MNRMTNKPLLWVLGGGAFAFVAVVTYWIFSLALANQMKSDLVPPEMAASYIHAVIEANRTIYTQTVVDKLHKAGVAEALEHWRDETGVPLPAQFLLESGRLVAEKKPQILLPPCQHSTNLRMEWTDNRVRTKRTRNCH